LKRIIESDNNGGVEWDGKDAQGNELKTGIYFFKVIQKLPNGNYDESSIKKFAIII
jgi:flagellar hook assembly protein FlgD